MTYQTKTTSSFSVVFGYIPQIEKKRDAPENLHRKFSLVLSSYRQEIGEMFFDFRLFLQLMETTLSAFEYDEIPLYLNKKDFLTFENKELLFRYFENELYSEAANELSFLKMIVLKNKKPLLQVLPEDYTGIGGPAPYHDSITFTCLCENINEEFLLKKLKEKALIPDKVIYGKEFPQLNLIQKLKCCTPLLRWAVRFRQLILKKAMKKR